MKLPIILHGRQLDVRKRCQQAVTRLARGERYLDVIGETCDDHLLSGNIVLQGGRGSLAAEVHVHCYLIAYEVMKAVDAERLPENIEDEIVESSLGTSWGIATLLGSPGESIMLGQTRWGRFLRAVRAHWEDLISVGPRYAYSSRSATELWNLPTTIQTALARIGVPVEQLQGGLTHMGLEPFAEYLIPS